MVKMGILLPPQRNVIAHSPLCRLRLPKLGKTAKKTEEIMSQCKADFMKPSL